MPLCKCGCGQTASRIWFSTTCRERWRGQQRSPEQREYAKQRAERNKRLAEIPMHEVIATVHSVNGDDERLVRKQLIRVPVPTIGIWGI